MKRILFLIILIIIGISVSFYMFSTDRRLNVVLVSIDTLRPDHLGCYGYNRSTSPAIDKLAREGTRFEKVVSSTTWTLPAHHALMTSLPDPVHGVLWDNHTLDENRITLAEVFKENGYRTAGFFTGPYLLPQFGFYQGFDEYIDATLYDKKLKGPDVLVASEKGRTTTGVMDRIEAWLFSESGNPFFLFIHLFDVHPDFDPPAPYDTVFDPNYQGNIKGVDIFHNKDIHEGMDIKDINHLIALYDGEIRFVDEEGIGRLIKILRKNKILNNTLIVITSDHGEEFFEHGEFGHRLNLYDTTLLIPLIFYCPDRVPQGRVIKKQVCIIDIMPTILDLVNLPQSPESLGRSLVPFMEGKPVEKGSYAFSVLIGGSLFLESLRTDDYKVIKDNMKKEDMFFDLKKDPDEENSITDLSNSFINDALRGFSDVRNNLISYKARIPRSDLKTPEVSKELRERIESLGYVNK